MEDKRRLKLALALVGQAGSRDCSGIVFLALDGGIDCMKKFLLYCFIAASFASCKKAFEYSPHEVRLDENEKNINEKNIAKISLQPSSDSLKFIVIGDPQRAYDELDGFVDAVNQLNGISFVVVDGDLTDFGLNSEFKWTNKILSKLKVPSIAVIGNHDMLGNGPEVYRQMYGPDNFSFSIGSNKFICLNSNSQERNYDGTLPNLPWLSNELVESSSYDKVFVFSHIAPFSFGFDSAMEKSYASLLAQNSNVKLSIHAHIDMFLHTHYYNDNIDYLVVDTIRERKYVLVTVRGESYEVEEKTF